MTQHLYLYQGVVEPFEQLTSYSWRRLLPTVSGLIDPPSGLGNCFPGRLAEQDRGARLDAVPLQRRQVRPVHADQDESLPRGC